MVRQLRLLAVLLLVMLLLTGCWSRREINDLVIAVGMGVDKVEEGYLVSVQVVDPGEITGKKGSGRAPVTVYKAVGHTVFDAIRIMTSTSARKIYFSHLRMFLIGEETARTEGISHVMEFISRDHELREDYYIAIARKTKALDILKGLSAIEKIPANKMFTSLEMSSKNWAATGTIKIDELISDLMTEGTSPVITGIKYIGDISKADKKENTEVADSYVRLKYEGMGVFRGDKLVGWLDEDESKGYNYFTGKVKSTVKAIACPEDEGELSVELQHSKSSISVKRVGHAYEIHVHIHIEGNIGEAQCKLDLSDPNTITKVEKLTAADLEDHIRMTLNKAKKLQSDFIGLGAAIHRKNPQAWKQLREDWPEAMAELPVFIHAQVKLLETGKTKDSFLNKVKE